MVDKMVGKMVVISALMATGVMFTNLACHSRPEEASLQPVFSGVAARDLYVELPKIGVLPDKRGALAGEESRCRAVITTHRDMELVEIGTYFITAYCPAECGGSWSTASGTTCHRADWENRYDEPTTVAIDRRYHSFGDEFYIEEFDRTFIAEDTGPGVQGRWIDIFYEDYSDVLSFQTGYYTVYSVEWVEYTEITFEYK